jgi:hypothetical protein
VAQEIASTAQSERQREPMQDHRIGLEHPALAAVDASAKARGTESPSFAGKGHKFVVRPHSSGIR